MTDNSGKYELLETPAQKMNVDTPRKKDDREMSDKSVGTSTRERRREFVPHLTVSPGNFNEFQTKRDRV